MDEPDNGQLILQYLLDALDEHVILHDPEFRLLWVNRAEAEHAGQSREELIGQRCHEIWHQEPEPCADCAVHEAIVTGRCTVQERDRGERGLWLVHAYPVRDPSGNLIGIAQIGHDITERRRAEAALRESEEQFRSLAEKLPQVIFINQDGRIVYCNEAAEELSGYSREELMAPDFDFRRLIAPDWMEQAMEMFQRHLAGEETPPYEYAIRTRDDRELRAINATRLISYQGRPAILGIITDITRRLEAVDALRASEARYRALVETSPDAITWTALDGTLLMTNQRAAELHGFASAEALLGSGLTAFDLVAPEDRRRARAQARRALEEGTVRNIEYRLQRVDGSTVPVELSASRVDDPDGSPHSFVGIVRDISQRKRDEEERRRLEEQMQHTQKLESLGVLAGGIAHDFNNLLMGVLGYAGLILRELPEDSPVRADVEQIETAAHRAAELTRQLLAYSGKGRFVTQPLDLSELVEEMAHLLRVTIAPTVTLQHELARDLPRMEGDPAQLRQVVMNLLTNASEAIGDDAGTVTIRTGRVETDPTDLATVFLADPPPAAGHIYLEVCDTGCGMDEKVRRRIFDPFFTTKFAGRGLGLASVLGIVRGHQGAITVASDPGQGSTLRVHFPVAGTLRQETLPPEVESGAPWRGEGLVLVVDDEPAVRDVARRTLLRAGFEVLVAADGLRGWDTFTCERERLVAVLLDLSMPGLVGEKLAARMRAQAPDLPILISSGHGLPDARERLLGLGVSGFVQKPYLPDQLLGHLRLALDRESTGG
jgi:PAS domain S-box-containing protein